MGRLWIAAFAFALALPTASAQDEMASEATIKEMLAVTKFRALMDGQRAQMEGRMRTSLETALSKNTLNEAQKEVLVKKEGELSAIVLEALDYNYLEPMAIDMYRKTFTEREAQGTLAFYRSPAGQAVIEKMPLLMQQMMQMIQNMSQRMEPRLREWRKETQDELKAARDKPDPPVPGTRP